MIILTQRSTVALTIMGVVLLHCCVTAQQANADSTKPRTKAGNIFKFAINSVSRSPADTAIISTKSENLFLPFRGKMIRHIFIKEFGFEQSFTDTTRRSNYFGTKLLNNLHRNSRQWVIRNNLFIKENTAVDPFKMADNERYFRSLEFIQDARILIKPVDGEPDWVDVEVITKDLFSVSGSLGDLSPGSFKAGISDANVLGMGQKVAFNMVVQNARCPGFGYSLLYNKVNIAHTFINAGFGYSTINPDLENTALDEHAWYITLQRPLISQYSHFAGGITLGRNQSYNLYSKPSYSFYMYGYNAYDAWLGYNLGINKYLRNGPVSNRQFISFRYLKNDFYNSPYQTEHVYNFRFNNRQAVLAQYTIFKQDFYKTNYIYGFGNTEDVPNGYNIALTSGWYQQSDLNRLYTGIDVNRYVVSNAGDFIQYFLRAGGFLNKGKVQDAAVLIGTGIFSRLMVYRSTKLRGYANLSYTRLFNRTGLDPLNLNNIFGLRDFTADSVMGVQRLSLYAETFMFLKYKLFGFKFAPFMFGDGSLLTPENRGFLKSDIYYGIGGGLRARNENLVFNTSQLRFVYFPRNPLGNNYFKITLSADIKFRYNSNYVNEPDIIQLNAGNPNGIY